MTAFKKTAFLFLLILLIFPRQNVLAAAPSVSGKSAVLIDVETGKVLYAKNETERMYPASLTKILTALVALDYLSPDELVVIGPEINLVPYDASRAGHKIGESITVKNLIRAIMIKSGNESCYTLAHLVAQVVKDEDEELSYAAEEKMFSKLMNEKARELGALSSNFVNSHGYHNPSQYSTAQDLAIISMAAMENDLIREIAKEASFIGNGAGENITEGTFTQDYKWESTNYILSKPEYFYQYATGLKTGFTDQAGQCLAATAEKDGRRLVSVILFSEDPDRWLDTVSLFEYGFNNFSMKEIQKQNEVIDRLFVYNPRLGEQGEVSVLTSVSFSDLYSEEEYEKITMGVVYNDDVIYKYTEQEQKEPGFINEIKLITPIEKGQTLGKVNYYFDGKLIFSSEVKSGSDVLERTFNSDVDYYIGIAKAAAFSGSAIPFWVGGVLLIVGIIHLVWWTKRRKKRRQFSLRDRF